MPRHQMTQVKSKILMMNGDRHAWGGQTHRGKKDRKRQNSYTPEYSTGRGRKQEPEDRTKQEERHPR